MRKIGLAVAWLLLGGSFLSFIAAVTREGPHASPPVDEAPVPAEPEARPTPPSEPVDERWSRLSTPDPRVITALALSPDGALLAGGNSDGAVFVWNSRGAVIARLRNHAGRVTALAFGDNGRTLASGAQENRVHLWNIDSGRLLHTVVFTDPRALSFSSDGEFLAIGGGERWILLVNRATLVSEKLAEEHTCSALAFSPAGGRLAVGSPAGLVRIWSMRERELFAECEGHDETVAAIAWGVSLISAGAGGSTRVWHPHTGRRLAVPERRATVISADAETFLHDVDEELVLTREDLRWQLTRPGPVTTLALAGDGSAVAVSCRNGTVWRRQLTK